MLKHVPNILTIIRFLLIPPIVLTIVYDDLIMALVFLILSGTTDVLDGAIARKFNTTVDDIKRLNNLVSNNLSIGQKLIINQDNNKEETIQNNPSSNIYTVKSGDSLYAIARKFNTTVDDIKRLNNLVSNNLSIGQKLII